MPKLTIIDGNSLLFRAYYATAYPGVEIMRNVDGTPTNAIFAFSNMINKILSGLKEGESIFVAFDAGKHNFRHEALETYKANRKPAPEDLVKQFPIVREFLKAINIFQFEEEGYEGDDIAGTVAKKAESLGYEVSLYTSDRDFLQLVTEKIQVHILKKGLSDVAVMTPQSVMETYGFEPKQIIDFKGLRGDSSDNLPGIPGIGDKTAVKLIQTYKTFDNIVAHAEEISGKTGQSIIENKELGTLCRNLAIIKTDVPLSFEVSELIYKGYRFKELNEFCQKYGLKQFINKVCPKWKNNDEVKTEIEVEVVNKLPQLSNDKIGIALDFENDDYTSCSIYGIAISADKNYYLKFEDAQKDEYLKQVLKDSNIKKYCYDYKSIKVALAKRNIEINGLEFDLLIASYLIDSSLKNNPSIILNKYDIDLGDKEAITLFSEEDIQKTSKISYFSRILYSRVLKELEEIDGLKLYKTIELPLVDTLSDIEIEGFPLDRATLDSFGDVYKLKQKALAEEIYEMAGERFNLASPKQIGEILFNKLGLTSNRKLSTSFDFLNGIRNEHPIVDKLLEYRKYFKLVTTYIDGLKVHIKEDGKIYAKFNQALTTTGRLSSSEPNLQNISVKDEEGKQIRKAFFYKEENYEILSLDYSQIELRVLASLSNCSSLKEIIASGKDIHSETAKNIFNLKEEPTSVQRRKAKTVNFGIVYGISDWGLAEELEIPVGEAKTIINNFYNAYPEISVFFTKVIQDAIKDGYVSTLLGRKRYLRELHDANYQVREFAKRAAMNAPIQGTAADIIKMAMIKVGKALKENNMKTMMVSQIHDELIFKVPLEEKDKAYSLIKHEMENVLDIGVPLQVDGGYGKSWFEAK